MRKLIQWASGHGHWRPSSYLGLPKVQRQDDPLLQQWQVVAGGIALVLSRVAPSERKARFASTAWLYPFLRQRLREARSVDVSPELLSDVMHELAGVADPLTIRCVRARFDASLSVAGGRAGSQPGDDSRPTGVLQSQPRPATELNFSATLPTIDPGIALAGRR